MPDKLNVFEQTGHSREGGNPACVWRLWIPAFAGMTAKTYAAINT